MALFHWSGKKVVLSKAECWELKNKIIETNQFMALYPSRVPFCTSDAKVSKGIFEKTPNGRRCLCYKGWWKSRDTKVRNKTPRFLSSGYNIWSRAK